MSHPSMEGMNPRAVRASETQEWNLSPDLLRPYNVVFMISKSPACLKVENSVPAFNTILSVVCAFRSVLLMTSVHVSILFNSARKSGTHGTK